MNRKCSYSKSSKQYTGFEQGPIRPPSEAYSLLIRVTRNCPWNQCTFCPVYKGSKFSKRSVEDIKKDIDIVMKYVNKIKRINGTPLTFPQTDLNVLIKKIPYYEINAFYAAANWYKQGMKSVFLQDSNSLIIKPDDLIQIITHIKNCFPWIKRITSYARSITLVNIMDNELKALAKAGLNRIHIGLESGSDEVLKIVKKGSTKDDHIKAGIKVKKAGIELSEYIMPGIGGIKLSKIHALESADALNKINPDFIRLRQLAIPKNTQLYNDFKKGIFKKCTDKDIVKELILFINNLDGITSLLKSDHILNLFENLEGKIPDDKEKLIKILNDFLKLRPKKQRIYQLGRRLGIFSNITDLENPYLLSKVEDLQKKIDINEKNLEEITDDLMNRYI